MPIAYTCPQSNGGTKFPKSLLPLETPGPPSNTPIPRPTPLTTPNGARIYSAILPQYTFQTERATNRLTDETTQTTGLRH